MRISGDARSEEQMKRIAIGGFVLIAAAVIWYEVKDTFFPPTTAPAPVAVVSAPQAAPAKAATPEIGVKARAGNALDPTLHMEAMLVSESLEYSGNGRNIFSMNSAPAVINIPKPIKPARVVAVAPPPPPVPCPPNCPPPPPPPPIDLKFFGEEISASGVRQACLLHDDNVYLALAGDIVMRRYKVISIDAKSIQVEDMQNNNKQVLPLLSN
jgi:hypothetical protein